MLILEIRSFILSHGDPSVDQCEDSLAFDDQKHRYAVADGVSNTFRPDYVSQFLVNRFVEDEGKAACWAEDFQSAIAGALIENWHGRVDEFLSKYTGFALEIRQKRLEDKGCGGSTFCGIEIDPLSKSVSYAVIGDSCLYYVPADGRIQVVTCGEMDKHDNGIVPIVHFNNVTDCILVDMPESAAIEKWKKGSFGVSDGYLALMTDGAAHWFLDKLTASPDTAADSLWQMLDNPEEMTDYVMMARQSTTPLSDDLAIIMIKLSQAEPEPESKSGRIAVETDVAPSIVPEEVVIAETDDTEIDVATELNKPMEEPIENTPPRFQPEEATPPRFQPIEEIPPRFQSEEASPPRFQPIEEIPPRFQPEEATPPRFLPIEEIPPRFRPEEATPPRFQPIEEIPPRFQHEEATPPRFQPIDEIPPKFLVTDNITPRFHPPENGLAYLHTSECCIRLKTQLEVRPIPGIVLFFRNLLSKIKSLCQSLTPCFMMLFF